jgi:predicted Zn-dependent protease with MMP-like domain
MDAKSFARIVEQAIARIPPELAGYLDNVLITVQPSPPPDLLAEMGYAPDEMLFGLFTGVPLNERSLLDPPLYPATIYLFQEPLEGLGLSREELIEEIEITVVHEVAHFFGFDEEDLNELGYG